MNSQIENFPKNCGFYGTNDFLQVWDGPSCGAGEIETVMIFE